MNRNQCIAIRFIIVIPSNVIKWCALTYCNIIPKLRVQIIKSIGSSKILYFIGKEFSLIVYNIYLFMIYTLIFMVFKYFSYRS